MSQITLDISNVDFADREQTARLIQQIEVYMNKQNARIDKLEADLRKRDNDNVRRTAKA